MPVARRTTPHRVTCLVADGLNTFELGTVGEVFATMHPDLAVPWWYSLTLCTETPGPVRTAAGFDVAVSAGLEALRKADTIVVPSTIHEVEDDVSPRVVRALRRAYDRGARIASICTGAFTLASAGLLDGLEATTHWRFTSRLQERFPEVRVRPRVLYVDNGRVLTSAGVAAGVDLCLHIVRRDHGHEVASRLANWMVVAAHREGGQSQFMEQPVATAPNDDPIAAAVGYARDNLASDLNVETLARVAQLSTRQFERRFASALCSSPARWVARERIQASRELLAGSEIAVDIIAERVGMSVSGFRANFKQELGVSPAAYRKLHREDGASYRLKTG
jgi:AraC family transcriptional activator FtrA